MNTFSIPIILFLILIVALVFYVLAWKYNKEKLARALRGMGLRRHAKNPILSPLAHYEWENGGTFNPAAYQDDSGRVHLLYRSIGGDGVSRIGYASSPDGVKIDERLSYPVFALQNPRYNTGTTVQKYDFVMYPSGGSWGGCEDPRMVRIGKKIYVTFNAFDGWDFIRVAVISIDEQDFLNKRWKWSKPHMISPHGEVHKNWVLFPEKINGKFAVLHCISPRVLVDYVDSLSMVPHIKSCAPHDGNRNYWGRKDYWDNQVRSPAAPPVRTEQGWLLLYHAMDRNDPNKYKIGAMVLNHDDPSKIIYRSPQPILSPEMHYENDGKPGVVYACGAIIKDDKLFVYYGGGDRHVCVGQVPLKELMDWLVEYGRVE